MSTLTQSTLTTVLCQSVADLRKVKVTDVEYINSSITYDEFFLRFLVPNRPCVFGPHITQDWRSVREWVTKDGRPNFNYLAQMFGSTVVPVADCRKIEYSAQPKSDMKLTEYLNYWQDIRQDPNSKDEKCLYLKDWHFTKTFPDYNAYTTPTYCASDWMNEYWDVKSSGADDYRFVYMGPKGSWTPFHADVFRSYSWSANICGRKRWLLFPPGQEDYLRDTLGNLVYDLTSRELHDENKYPHYRDACEPFEVIQGPGEVIFVPSGWHHQVFNIEDTISINHNWLNGCNVDLTWKFLQQELASVKASISDCIDMDNWDQQCQIIMKASTGIDYSEFLQLLWTVASTRLHQLHQFKKCHMESDMADGKCTIETLQVLAQKVTMESQTCERHLQSDEIKTTSTSEHSSSEMKILPDHPNPSPCAPGLKTLDVKSTTAPSGDTMFANQKKDLPQAKDKHKSALQLSESSNSAQKSFVWDWMYDLHRITEIVTLLLDNEDFCKIEKDKLCTDPQEFLTEISSALKNTP
ncbi:2-oxoglutarate and iron-dependent oxygenase JMJD4-like [Asterias amurensis]|uniref:2-oxoglutarate and iron-dependent oxygenase JMJD4-like n=1 Tax=Asterias amurensis TaxID=7602 RepID=UPI003AB5AA8A